MLFVLYLPAASESTVFLFHHRKVLCQPYAVESLTIIEKGAPTLSYDNNYPFGTVLHSCLEKDCLHYSALPRPGTPISRPHEEVDLSCLCRIHGVCPGLRPIIKELGNGQTVSCGSKPQSHKRPLKLLISNRIFCFQHPLDGWSKAWSGDMALWNPIFWGRKP